MHQNLHQKWMQITTEEFCTNPYFFVMGVNEQIFSLFGDEQYCHILLEVVVIGN